MDYETEYEKAVDAFWGEATTEKYASDIVYNDSDCYQFAGKVLAFIAQYKALDEAARIDFTLPLETRNAQRKSDAVEFAKEIIDLVELQFKTRFETEAEKSCNTHPMER